MLFASCSALCCANPRRTSTFRWPKTFAQPAPLPKSNAGAGLLAQILVSTFADHLPLNRPEAIFKRHGVDLPRSTLCEWKLASGELLAVLRAPLIAHTLAAPRLHSDDTTMPLIVGWRGTTKTARLWGYLGAGARRPGDPRLLAIRTSSGNDGDSPHAPPVVPAIRLRVPRP